MNNYLPFPVSVSAMGIWGSALIGQVCVRTGLWTVHKKLSRHDWMHKIVPIALLSVLTLALGNAVYMYLSVAFTQMLKALSPAYILMVMWGIGLRVPSTQALAGVALISVGTCLAAVGELRFSLIGFLLQSAADTLEGFRVVILQKLMANDKMTPKETIYYIFPVTGFFQALLALALERELFTNDKYFSVLCANLHIFLACIVLGFVLNFASNAVVQLTSGLTFKLIGIVRNNMLVLASILFLGDSTTLLQVVGYSISAAGFARYTMADSGAPAPIKIVKKANKV
jgi:Triose-phosphate Transporter family